MKRRLVCSGLTVLMLLSLHAHSFGYPIDGYALTGIRRLDRLQLIVSGKLPGVKPPSGALKSTSDVKLNLAQADHQGPVELPPVDPELQRSVDMLFPDRDASYGLALLDITPGRAPRVAFRKEDEVYSPGSVGKLAIVAGLFAELKNLYPDSPERRRQLLRDRTVVAEKWIHTDHHDVPVFDAANRTFESRPIREGDAFSLYEWADHMVSASANAAASTLWKEVMLMRHFGASYPPTREEEKDFFEKTLPTNLRNTAMSVVNDPLRAIGIEQGEWQLGSFFTSAGKKIVPGGGGSMGTPLGLLKFLFALEGGRIVDEWSSLEIKRLMYMTAKRIRYASSPALTHAAVYFKSGSLYRCKPEPEFRCGKYMGNVDNYMNSVAIIEHPEGRTYLSVLMSNVLRKNSAVEHQTIATLVDRSIAK